MLLEEVDRLAVLVRDVLDFARPQAARPSVTDLDQLSRRAAEEFRSEFAADLEKSMAECRSFAADYRGKLESIVRAPDAGARLFAALKRYEAIDDLLGRIGSYAGLLHAGDQSDPQRAKFYGDAHEKLTVATTELLFFTLELNRIDDALIDAARARPKTISVGTTSPGGSAHTLMHKLQKMTGAQFNVVSFKSGAESVTAVMGGHIQATAENLGEVMGQVETKKLRLLGVPSLSRVPGLPNVPTLKELGYDVEFSLWVGLFAPKGTPDPVIVKLRTESKKAVESDIFKKAIDNIGDVVAYLDAPDFAKFWDADAKRVEAAVQSIGKE